jgi:hypothetical protein
MAETKYWYVRDENILTNEFGIITVDYTLVPLTTKQVYDLNVLEKKIQDGEKELEEKKRKGTIEDFRETYENLVGKFVTEFNEVLYGPEEDREIEYDPTYNLRVKFPESKPFPFREQDIIHQSAFKQLKDHELEPNVPKTEQPPLKR